jgi:hypothetical protein
MIKKSELPSRFHTVYDLVTKQNQGGFFPDQAVQMIDDCGCLNKAQRLELEKLLLRPPVEAYLYPDSLSFLQGVLSIKDQALTIYTQGDPHPDRIRSYQLAKIAQAGLARQLPSWKNRSQELGIPRIMGGLNKSQVLYSYLLNNHVPSVVQAVIVDDRADEAKKAIEIIQAANIPTHAFCIPRKSAQTEFSGLQMVQSLSEIPISEIAQKPTWWLVDLDYTLIDHGKIRDALAILVDNFLSNNQL